MRNNILFLAIPAIILISVSINVQNVVAQETDPYTIYGTVKDEKGVVVAGATITVENINTQEKNTVGNDTITGSAIQVITDTDGLYTFELINLENGYHDGDEILVTAEKNDMIGTNSINVNAGSWGSEVDIILGREEVQEKESWSDSFRDLWYLFLLLAVILAIILIAVLLRRKDKTEPEDRQYEPPLIREESSEELTREEPEPDYSGGLVEKEPEPDYSEEVTEEELEPAQQSTIIEESVAYECPKCGHEIKEEDTSCSNCGVRFAEPEY